MKTQIHSLEDGRSLTGKSSHWLGPQQDPLPSARTALFFFLGVLTVVFGLLSIAYRMRMSLGDWQPLSDPWQLWLNTAMLFFSSGVFELTRQRLRRAGISAAHDPRVNSPQANSHQVRNLLLLAGVLAITFLIGQLWVWQLLMAQGYYLSANPANSFFYLITGLHGLHLLGGLVVWLYSYRKVCRVGSLEVSRISIELCCHYWHFLLLVWLLMLALLLRT